ncbi:hypothetical protein QF040_005714 [Variovorax sp. W2I14]
MAPTPERSAVNECALWPRVVSHARPRVVVLAPGDRMEVRVAGVRRGGERLQRGGVDLGEELHLRRERREVVPLVLEGEALGHVLGRRVVRDDFDVARAVRSVVVEVRVAQQAFVVRPVVFGAERVVQADEAAAAAHVVAQRGARRILARRDRAVPQGVAVRAREDDRLVVVDAAAEHRDVFGPVDRDAFGRQHADQAGLHDVVGVHRRVQARAHRRAEHGMARAGCARIDQHAIGRGGECAPVVVALGIGAAAHVVVGVEAVVRLGHGVGRRHWHFVGRRRRLVGRGRRHRLDRKARERRTAVAAATAGGHRQRERRGRCKSEEK